MRAYSQERMRMGIYQSQDHARGVQQPIYESWMKVFSHSNGDA